MPIVERGGGISRRQVYVTELEPEKASLALYLLSSIYLDSNVGFYSKHFTRHYTTVYNVNIYSIHGGEFYNLEGDEECDDVVD